MKDAALLMVSPIDTSLLVLLAAGLAAQMAGSAGSVVKGGVGGLKSKVCDGTH